MRSQDSFVLFAFFAGIARSQTFPNEASLPGCGETCLDNLVAQGSMFGCTGGAVNCLCGAANFKNGVHDCANAACAPDLFPSVTNYLASVCATAVGGSVTSAGAPPTTTPGVPTTSTPPAPTTVSTTSPTAQGTTTTSSSTGSHLTSTPPSTTTPSTNTSASGAPAQTTTATTGGPGSTSSPQSSTSSTSTAAFVAPVASTSPTSSAAATTSPSLSAGAKAGIGIGAAVGAVAVVAAVVTCVIARKHKSRKGARSTIHISDPMPGSGRFYAHDDRSQHFDNVSELEMKSRRYEDMVPRQVPRNMV